MLDENTNVLLREIDTKSKQKEHIKEKIGSYYEQNDLEERNCFSGGVGIGTIKCVSGCNHYEMRNSVINKGLVDDRCPRCNGKES